MIHGQSEYRADHFTEKTFKYQKDYTSRSVIRQTIKNRW